MYSLNDVTQITKIQYLADTKYPVLNSCLVALPSSAFYGAKYTIQRCSTLRLVVTYCQLIMTIILPLSWVAILHQLHQGRMWTYTCLPTCSWKRLPGNVVASGEAIMAFFDNQSLQRNET